MDTVTIVLTADQYGDQPARVEIWLGDQGCGTVDVLADRSRGEAQAFTFTTDDFGGNPTPHVGCFFKNDAYGGTAATDRNAYLVSASLNGAFHPHGDVWAMNSNDSYARIDLPAATLAAPAPIATPPAFQDLFASDDPARWIAFDGQHWPPLKGTPGTWSRCFFTGWPTNSGSQDCAARSLASNKEAQCYEDRGVSITAGGLVLTATRDSNNHHNLPWTSGVIVQNRDVAQLYGFFEAEASLPPGKGFWPAFWLLSADGQWPPEIDVIEKVGKDENNVATDAAYRAGVVGGDGAWVHADLAGLHRYGLLWTADTCTFFLDRRQVGQVATPANARRPMYMLLNLAVGGSGSWPGEPDPGVSTAQMVVRSVRCWALGSWSGTALPITA